MGLKCGIVGLPNVGKSTLFNALTNEKNANVANYPFCTIEPNVGVVNVPDARLESLAKIANSEKVIPAILEFVDIAGLVKGASKGDGLGNQFLSNIREVDAIIHVVRCFEDDDITHVEGGIDPVRDLDIIVTELMLADLESLQKRVPKLQKKAKQSKECKAELELVELLIKHLEDGKLVSEIINDDNYEEVKNLQLLTSKPAIYVANVSEDDIHSGNQYTNKLKEYTKSDVVIISADIEAEIAALDNIEERQEFLEDLGLKENGLSVLIRAGYQILDLITFFTIGPKEARAWTIPNGALAPRAGRAIHSDFERGFIKVEHISYNDYVQYKGEVGAKDNGKLQIYGKDYKVIDGDILMFRFNV